MRTLHITNPSWRPFREQPTCVQQQESTPLRRVYLPHIYAAGLTATAMRGARENTD